MSKPVPAAGGSTVAVASSTTNVARVAPATNAATPTQNHQRDAMEGDATGGETGREGAAMDSREREAGGGSSTGGAVAGRGVTAGTGITSGASVIARVIV